MSPKIKHRAQLAKQDNQNGNPSVETYYMERQSILPPPAELAEYERYYNGITQTLVTEFKTQAEHRRNLEKTVITGEVQSAKRGQIFAFILCALTIIAGFVCILFDKNALGLATILGSLGSILCVFVYGTKSKRKERIEKSKANP